MKLQPQVFPNKTYSLKALWGLMCLIFNVGRCVGLYYTMKNLTDDTPVFWFLKYFTTELFRLFTLNTRSYFFHKHIMCLNRPPM